MEESSVRRSLEALCQELNMDEQTATEAMESFTAIWNTYTLEVNTKPGDRLVRSGLSGPVSPVRLVRLVWSGPVCPVRPVR